MRQLRRFSRGAAGENASVKKSRTESTWSYPVRIISTLCVIFLPFAKIFSDSGATCISIGFDMCWDRSGSKTETISSLKVKSG